MSKEREKLVKQIADAKAKLELLEKQVKNSNRSMAIKELSEFTDEEKINFFDKLYNSAYSELVDTESNGYHNEDCVQYDWEEYIEILARDHDAFWKYWRKL